MIDTGHFGHFVLFKDKEDILKDIHTRAKTKTDRQVTAPEILAINDKVLHYCLKNRSNRWESTLFTDSALSQLLNRAHIPVSFYKRNPTDIQESIFNHHVSNYNNPFLFRYERIGPIDHIRAVLSNTYGIMDDDQVFPIIIETLSSMGIPVQYNTFCYDNKISQLTVVFPDTNSEYNGITISSGLTITNSETGHSSIWIVPVVYYKGILLTNKKSLATQSVNMRIIHKGKIDKSRIEKIITEAKDISQVGIVQFAEAMTQSISSKEALKFTKNIEILPKRLFDILEEEWGKEEDLKRVQVAMRILDLAKALPLFQRSKIEQSVGGVVNIFNNYKTRMDSILEELE